MKIGILNIANLILLNANNTFNLTLFIVSSVVWIGILVFIYFIGKKVKKLEEEINEKE